MIHYETLQNATDITKCNKKLLQNRSGLLQIAIVLLQNATVITNCDGFITKCDSTTQHRVNTEELYFLKRETNNLDTVQGCRERGLLKFKRTFKKKHASVSEITIIFAQK